MLQDILKKTALDNDEANSTKIWTLSSIWHFIDQLPNQAKTFLSSTEYFITCTLKLPCQYINQHVDRVFCAFRYCPTVAFS